jgi:hypothetical protein
MPNWKKLIYSGSAAVLSNVSASSYTGSFTGSLFGTSSWAVSSSRAITSSYSLNALSSSYALSASFAPAGAAFPYTGSARVTGSFATTGSIIATENIEAQVNLKSMFQSGDEGGEIFLNAPATNTTINTGVTVDINQDKFRIFENGGVNRGYYLDISAGAPGVGTNLKPSGYNGIVNIMGNPPGQQFLNFTDGILISVT